MPANTAPTRWSYPTLRVLPVEPNSNYAESGPGRILNDTMSTTPGPVRAKERIDMAMISIDPYPSQRELVWFGVAMMVLFALIGVVIRLGTRGGGRRRSSYGPSARCWACCISPFDHCVALCSGLDAPGVSPRVAPVVPGSGHRLLSRHYPGWSADTGPGPGPAAAALRAGYGQLLGSASGREGIITIFPPVLIWRESHPEHRGRSGRIRTGWLLLGVILILIVLCEAGLRLALTPRDRLLESSDRTCTCSPSVLPLCGVYGARDDYTVASHLSKLLHTKGYRAQVTSYGGAAYVSTQGLITLLRCIRRGEILDIALS